MKRTAGEFVVIVVGVLVALLAESAWEDRQERLLADGYMERLVAEVEVNYATLEGDERHHEVICPAARLVQDELWDGGGASDEQLLLASYIAALHRQLDVRTSTYEDLVATGRLRLIEDPELRDRIITFYDSGVNAIETWRPRRDNEYRRLILQTLPLKYTGDQILPCLVDRGSPDNELRSDWEACVAEPAEGAAYWLDRLRDREELRGALGDRVYEVCNFVSITEQPFAALDTLAIALGVTDGGD